MSKPSSFLESLRSAGILATDTAEIRLQKSLLIFATGLISFASMLWLLIYWQIGPQFSSTIPFVFQMLLVGNLLIYLKTQNFPAFRLIQLSFILFMPFVAQWSMGNFITASGVSLWGLLAPVGAVLCIGAYESLAWFIAYIFLMILSGTFDYLLAEFPQLAGDASSVRRAQDAVRAEFAGEEVYIPKRNSKDVAGEVLRLFNGRNATEVARRLGIHRATVYRYLKQPGK